MEEEGIVDLEEDEDTAEVVVDDGIFTIRVGRTLPFGIGAMLSMNRDTAKNLEKALGLALEGKE